MDSMIYGKKEILNLFFSSFNSFIVWTDFQWTYEFIMAFSSFDLVLAQTQPTFCSEAQVFHGTRMHLIHLLIWKDYFIYFIFPIEKHLEKIINNNFY